ncbi:uncharacterized protein TNCV_852201 [Trichonephila clavipes]|nr:uncharacterized protein TNCV_852201 [Trichonephila clavipes]
MATSTNKTAAFGVKLIHKCMSKHRYIQKNWLFGALYGLVESFFKNDEGHNVTVNGDRYRAMITNFFLPELSNHDVQELWFQQDGATCHTARTTIDLLKDTFGDRLISRFGPVNWPPRSCDLTPLDYFLWGYVKSLVYADKPQTLDHLEDNIRRVIADIRPQMLEKVIENWTSRLDYIRASRGSYMPEIIFKILATLAGVKLLSQGIPGQRWGIAWNFPSLESQLKFTLNNISHDQDEIEIASSPVNRDASEVVKQAHLPVWTRDCVRFPWQMLTDHNIVQSDPT